MEMQRVRVIDSHTGGEPTRVVLEGGPDLGGAALAERLERFRRDHDGFRSAVVNEPRGSDFSVGALLCEPVDPKCVTGVIFFNNVGYLGMCGHGTIGVMVTLAHVGRVGAGAHLLETPVGVVKAVLHNAHDVTIENVASFRSAADVEVEVDGLGRVTGDVAWGGNWFFLSENHGHEIGLKNVARLTEAAIRIRAALVRAGVTGGGGGQIDHIELFGPPGRPDCDSKNFVLCPGEAYDRSACGTGTSAKLACLAADGRLKEGQTWRQESIVGSVFEGSYRRSGGHILPSIRGSAYINSEATLLLDPHDPFCLGIRA